MVKKLTFYILYFFNVPILAKEEIYDSRNFKNIERNILTTKNNWKSLHIYNFQPSILRNPFFNFPVKTSTDMGLYEIKKFLSPLELNLTIDNKKINMFKYSSKEPPLSLILIGSLLDLLTIDFRYSIFNTFNFRSIDPSFFYLNP